MLRVRRTDLSPRVEMTPLIDVIFLLLTFFIYSMLVMVQAEVLPVALTPVTTGESAEADDNRIVAITMDRSGAVYVDREPVDADALDERLKELSETDPPPRLFVAMEAAAENDPADTAESTRGVDRGPLLIGLIERLRAAGLTDFSIVGPEEPR